MKRSLWFWAVIAVSAALAILLVPRIGSKAADSKNEMIRLGYLSMVASLPIFVAEDRQLFKQQQLGVQKKSFASSNDMVTALIAGQVDFLPAVSLVPIIHLEIQQPGTVRLFSHSRVQPSNAFDAILVADASPIRTVKDLAGRKVGVFPGTSAMNLFKAFLQKHNIDPSTVSFVQLAPPTQLASLSSGAVDAVFAYEPVIAIADQRGGFRRIWGSVYADLVNPCPIGAAVISRQFERRSPEAARRAIRAIDESALIMREQPIASRMLLPGFLQLPKHVSSRVNVIEVTLSKEVDTANLQRFIDLLYRVGEIPERIDAQRLTEPTTW